MPTAGAILQLCSVAAIGLWAGALLTEGCLLLPYWRGLPAAQFYALYRELHPRLYRYFTPLTIAPLLVTLVAAILSVTQSAASRWLLLIALGLCVCAAATHELYFQRANRQFAEAALSAEALAEELRRWALWHWVRTGLALLGWGAALVSLALS